MLDAALRAEILRLYHAEHWRVGTIARQLGVHHSSVECVLTAAGVERAAQRPRRRSLIDPYLEFIAETLQRYPTLTAARLSESLGELTHDSAFICPNLEELQAILTAAGHQMAKAAPSSHGYTTRGQTVICITVPEEREEARNL